MTSISEQVGALERSLAWAQRAAAIAIEAAFALRTASRNRDQDEELALAQVMLMESQLKEGPRLNGEKKQKT